MIFQRNWKKKRICHDRLNIAFYVEQTRAHVFETRPRQKNVYCNMKEKTLLFIGLQGIFVKLLIYDFYSPSEKPILIHPSIRNLIFKLAKVLFQQRVPQRRDMTRGEYKKEKKKKKTTGFLFYFLFYLYTQKVLNVS